MAEKINDEINIDVKTTGADEGTGALNKLTDAHDGVVVASDKMSKAQVRADRAYKSVKAQVDENFRATQRLIQGQSTLKRALDQGIISTEQYQRDMRQLATHFEKATQGADRARASFGRVNDATTGATSGVNALSTAFNRLALAAAGAFSVGALSQMADAWSDMQSRVGAAVKDMDAAPELMQRMVDLANASYSPLSQTVEVYTANVGALGDLGKSASEAADYTESLNHMLVLTATRGEQAASVQNALSKAMAVGKLQAQGLETILANGGEVAQALANELNTTVSGLRGLASQGKITGEVIANAIINPLEEVRARAGEMPATVADAFTRVGTNVTALVGAFDQLTGASSAVAGVIISVADGIRHLSQDGEALQRMFEVSATAAGLLAGVMVGRMVPGLIASGTSALTAAANLAVYDIATRRINASATATAVSLRVMNAAFGGPLGLAITGIAAGVAYWATRTDEATASLVSHEIVLQRVKAIYEDVGANVNEFASRIKEITYLEALSALENVKKKAQDAHDALWSEQPFIEFEAVTSAGLAKIADAFDRLERTGDIGVFNEMLVDANKLDPTVAALVSRLAEYASKYAEASGQVARHSDILKAATGDTEALARVMAGTTGVVAGFGNASAVATGQVAGLSDAMKEIIALAPGMRAAMKAQSDLAAVQKNFQIEAAEALTALQQTGNWDAFNSRMEMLNKATAEATGSITGLTAAQQKLDDQTAKGLRDSLPRAERARAELTAAYAKQRQEIQNLIETGESHAKVQGLLAQLAENEQRDLKNLNRDLAEQEAKRNKSASAADKQAKAEARLNSAVEQLIHSGQERIDLLKLEIDSYGKTSEESIFLKKQYDAQAAALRNNTKLKTEDIDELKRQAVEEAKYIRILDEKRKAIEAVNEVQDLVSATWVRGLEDMILKAQTLQDAIKGIGEAWSKASLDALLTGKGPLAQFTGLASNDPNNPGAVGGVFGLLLGNQTKLFNQLPKQIEKGAEAGTTTGAFEGARTGTIEGNVASGMPAFMQQYGKQILGVGAGLTSLVGAYGVGAAGGSPGMAGLGGAISGGMGGLSLAAGLSLSSAMMGPLAGIGAAIGAGLSLYANQQARNQAKQERMAQAQAAYQDAIPQIQSFTAALRGEITGSLQQTIDEVHKKANELGGAAFFAFQFDEVKRIENEFNAYVERTRQEFRDGYQGMLDQLRAGGGMSGAFSSAKNEMQSFGDELMAWVEDVKYAFQQWGGPVSDEATQAARSAALAMLEPVQTLTAVQSAIQQVNGRASALQGILEDLWMSSDDAARAINDGVLRAMDALRTSFSADLSAKLFDAQGKGYINEMSDAFAEMRQLYADAAALGIDEGERIWSYFRLSAQSIVDGAELTGSAFAELTAMFPELVGSVHEFVAAIDSAIQTADEFNASMYTRILGATGRAYITTAQELVQERDALLATAEQVGGNMALVEEYFAAAAQSIVDSSQLTGSAFSELLAWVPQLTDHVHEFAAAVQNVGKTAGEFYEDLIDKILGAQGKSYISDMRALIKERDELTATAQQLGVDVALVNQYFDLTAQNIVDNAQLTGEAFQDLLAWFPQLASQLTEFSAVAQQVGNTFWDVQNNIIDKILGAQGKGYIVDMRNLVRERDELTALAQSVGVDLGLVNQYFSLASQNIVDAAGLTGDAFADLIAWFPDLASSLREAGQAVEQTAAQIAAAAQRLRGYEDRFFNAMNDNGTLDGALRAFDRQAAADRAAELAAGGQHLVALERAIAAERLGVQAQFAAQAVSAAEQAVDAARQNLQRAAQAAIDASQAQVDAAQAAARAAADVVNQAQSRVDDAQRALERAQDAVRQGYEDQAAVLRDTVSRLQSFIKGIQQFKASLILDDALSPFSPQQRLAEAQRQFQDIAARAMGGDQDALDQLERVSRDYLSEARSYYASSEAYYQAFNDVQTILDQSSRTAQNQLSEAEQQLAALEAQIAALTRIDDTVLSIEQAQAELNAAVADLATAQEQQAQADTALAVAQANLEAVRSQMDALLGINQGVMSVYQAIVELTAAESALADAQRVQNDILAQQQAIANRNPNELFVQQAYRDVLGREADTAGLQYWANQLDVGAMTAAEVLRRMQDIQAAGGMRLGGIVGSYATGGMVGNGRWDVDSVLARYAGGGNIALAGGEFVTRAPAVNRDTLPTLAAINATGRLPANDDSARDEIRALRQEVASLKNELKQVLAAGFSATVAATDQNTGAVRTVERRIHQASGTR
ncbi:tape measure protein [Pseudochelatococcus sp. B33]